MYVVIQHTIKDPQAFWAASEASAQQTPPINAENTHFFWSADDSAAVCVYKTDSLDGLREYVDSGLPSARRATSPTSSSTPTCRPG